ncbi:MAG: hypothetical protein NWE96_00190 [Candidatus Bathyarchaeota archaeon]|nr:hypothetical protein [Candidatus Bathyarchaeota archaeon]
MISTVTTTTVTTIVTLTTGASIGVIATMLLVTLLGTQEVVSSDKRLPYKLLGKHLNVSILPLSIVFALIVIFKVLEVLA